MTNVLHKELIGDMSVKETVTAYRTSFFRAFGVCRGAREYLLSDG